MTELTNATLLETLEHLQSLIGDFHAVKGIRAWAAEENVATKAAALEAIRAAIAKVGPAA